METIKETIIGENEEQYVAPDPEFIGLYSSDEIWYAGEIDIRLTDVIDDKADIDHVHEGYATADHSHDSYSPSSHTHSGYASASHSHNIYAAKNHTHNYAGSDSANGAATSANKLNTDAGSSTQPVYFVNGVPMACTYTLGSSVPSGAKFTDTTYSAVTTSANGLMSASDKVKLDGMVIATISEVETYLGI